MLFEYTRLPFGISSAPAMSQGVIEGLLQNILGVVVYSDDVLIAGKTNKDHLKSLDTVLKWMEDAGMLLNKDKCCFMTKSVSYLGISLMQRDYTLLKRSYKLFETHPALKPQIN